MKVHEAIKHRKYWGKKQEGEQRSQTFRNLWTVGERGEKRMHCAAENKVTKKPSVVLSFYWGKNWTKRGNKGF